MRKEGLPRRVRTATGCRECRERRVKCPEGSRLSDGSRIQCKRCLESKVDCWYPKDGSTRRFQVTSWVKAVASDQSGAVSPSADDIWVKIFQDLQWSPIPLESSAESAEHDSPDDIGPPSSLSSLAGYRSTAIPPFQRYADSTGHAMFGDSSPPTAEMLCSPTPIPIRNFSLANISLVPGESNAISYFEKQGCQEVIATSRLRNNWIYNELFPRLYEVLLSTPDSSSPDHSIRLFVSHSLIRLSLVHRASMESNLDLAKDHERQGRRHDALSRHALTRLRPEYNDYKLQSGAYLIGLLLHCIASLLSSQTVEIDHEAISIVTRDGCSDFVKSVRDVLSCYSTLKAACDAEVLMKNPFHDPSPLQISVSGSDWIEHFWGTSRDVFALIGNVNRFIAHWRLLQECDLATSDEGLFFRAQAEGLAISLQGSLITPTDDNKPRRIQKGNGVVRSALLVLLLCELLDVDLDDPRLDLARKCAIELVSDTVPQEIAGYGWSVTIIATYTPDPQTRTLLQRVLRNAQIWAFGPNFKGVDDLLEECWAILDRSGRRYPSGIAPWRQLLRQKGNAVCI